MSKDNKMLSEAGKKHERRRLGRTLNTGQRMRMYNSIEVQPVPHIPKHVRATIQTIGREVKDSFMLRHLKQMVTNTNYHIKEQLVHPASHRQGFSKGSFSRMIGDVRDQDYSLPLIDDCDKRCCDAFITLPHQDSIVTTRDTHKARSRHHNMDFQKQLSRTKLNQSLDLKKVNSISSTQDSETIDALQPIKKRHKRQRNLQIHNALKKVRLFDHDIGHKYGEELFKPKKLPDFYDIQSSKQQLVKGSMSSPKGHVRFDSFRQKIATRYDRADPYWGMTLNYQHTHQNPEWNSERSVSFQRISERLPNQVYSKYPIRQNMSLITPLNYSPKNSSNF